MTETKQDIKSSLPKDWKWVKLGEIVSLLGDGLHGTPQYSENGDYFFINGNNLSDGKILIKENTKRVSVNEYEKYKKQLNDKTILVSINGTIGNVAFYKNEKVILGKSACYFNIVDNVDKHFIRLLLTGQRFLSYAHNTSTGSTIKNVSLKSMREFQIPLPPKPTQQTIVSKIEELFSELDKGIENLRTAQQQLKTYRQAVLKWAFDNLTKENTIEEVIESSLIGIVRSSKDQNDDKIGVPYVKMNNIDLNGNVDCSELVFVQASDVEVKKFHLKKGDILINTRNSFELVGKSGIVREEKTNILFNNNLLRLRVKDKFMPLFIGYQLINSSLKSQMLKEKKATTNICALYQRDIFPLRVKVCALQEQKKIIQEIESRLSVADKMEESINQSLQQAEGLRQSILKKAFEGKLIK